MKGFAWLLLLSGAVTQAAAQQALSLDSCRALALGNNKQLAISELQADVAANVRKSARTKYLPRISAVGSYMYNSRELSILNDDQKAALSGIGTTATSGLSGALEGFGAGLTGEQKAALDEALKVFGTTTDQAMGNLGAQVSGLASALNAEGQKVVDAFRTDTRNIFAGSVMLMQPVFMGGSIVAMNKMARLGEQMARSGIDAKRQQTIYEADRAYWAIVSLKHKQRLAQSYLELVSRLDGDVQKMIREGVATRSDGLSVKVKVNEAQMSLTQVNDGLALARMLLCQICGLPLDTDITLADEEADSLALGDTAMAAEAAQAMQNRPELQMLQATVDISRQATNLVKAGRLPQVALMGGYSFSNPNVFNGFQNKFGGVWSVGVLVRVPIWNWGDVAYKVKAAKGATAIASLELAEAREGVELQVSQSSFKVSEASRKLAMARASAEQAEENLRSANLGFREGVIQSTTVMEAQTAWVKAQSQKIDAEIEVKLSQVNLRKALGTLDD